MQALFDSGFLGAGKRGRLGIAVLRTMADFSPPPPEGFSVLPDTLLNPFRNQLYERRVRRYFAVGGPLLPRGGDARGMAASKLEGMLPAEFGFDAECNQVLWIRHLPVEEVPE